MQQICIFGARVCFDSVQALINCECHKVVSNTPPTPPKVLTCMHMCSQRLLRVSLLSIRMVIFRSFGPSFHRAPHRALLQPFSV